jgi:hypothetical protein
VTRTIWLASYPKSGNTWLRLLLANVTAGEGPPVNLNNLFTGGIASSRSCFDFIVLIDSGLLTHDEIDNLRPRAHAAMVREFEDSLLTQDAPSLRFIKVHDAYTVNPAGQALLGGSAGAQGAIVIVRDPRDVASSFAHHSGVSIDEAIAFMNQDDAAFCAKTRRQNIQLRQKLRGWSEHVASWLDQADIPVHLIRYEDLHRDTARTLGGALEFAGIEASADKLDRAVESCGFASLREEEQRNGFAEAPRRGIEFFRRGEVGAWRHDLTREQVVRIESHHARMMDRLGYELSHASDLACTG